MSQSRPSIFTSKGAVPCLLLGVSVAESWLVPNVCVAEVVPVKNLKIEWQPTTAARQVGFVNWRGLAVPLLGFQGEVDTLHPIYSKAQVAILNRLKPDGLPFWGLVLLGLPRLIRLQDQAEWDELLASDGESIAIEGDLGSNQPFMIPDLLYWYERAQAFKIERVFE
jgi:hypothetical protein